MEVVQGKLLSSSSTSFWITYKQTWSGGATNPKGRSGGSGGASRSNFGEPIFDSERNYRPRVDTPLRTRDEMAGSGAARGAPGYGQRRSPTGDTDVPFVLRSASGPVR